MRPYTLLFIGSVLFLSSGCSMPSFRLQLALESGEATTGNYQLGHTGSSYDSGTSIGSLVESVGSAGAAPSPSPAPASAP